MKTYRAYAEISGSRCLGTFTAETMEEAEEKAWDSIGSVDITLCCQCANKVDELTIVDVNVEEEETMIINANFVCPVCGKEVEGIKDWSGNYRCYCSHCHDWWYEEFPCPQSRLGSDKEVQ